MEAKGKEGKAFPPSPNYAEGLTSACSKEVRVISRGGTPPQSWKPKKVFQVVFAADDPTASGRSHKQDHSNTTFRPAYLEVLVKHDVRNVLQTGRVPHPALVDPGQNSLIGISGGVSREKQIAG